MFGRKKRKTLNYSVIISLLLLSCARQIDDTQAIDGFSFSGNTQGTTYSIIIAEEQIYFTQREIDSVLAEFDTVLSSYIESSVISRLNNATERFAFKDATRFFKTCYESAQEVYATSNGLFDPSVYSLVKEWGFFTKEAIVPSSFQIDSILQFTGFEKGKFHDVIFKNDSVFFTKHDSRFKLDFNGIAQGYSVDVIAEFIENRGHKNYYVEIGGELRVKGKNRVGKKWNIGIDVPNESDETRGRDIITFLAVSDCGMATSGNYRNYFEKDGQKYGHTLHPITGIPIKTDVLSATVIAPNATLADAYATVFLLLGKEKSIAFLHKNPDLQVVLVFIDENGEFGVFSSDKLGVGL